MFCCYKHDAYSYRSCTCCCKGIAYSCGMSAAVGDLRVQMVSYTTGSTVYRQHRSVLQSIPAECPACTSVCPPTHSRAAAVARSMHICVPPPLCPPLTRGPPSPPRGGSHEAARSSLRVHFVEDLFLLRNELRTIFGHVKTEAWRKVLHRAEKFII